MAEQNVNSFSELNSDSHGLNTQRNVMTDAMNATLTTKGEDQLILQNMTGNELKALITPGYTPIACEVFRNIAYIISAKYDSAGNFISGELGTYPSPRYDELFASGYNSEYFIPLIDAYQPLRNFNSIYEEDHPSLQSDETYTDPFRTSQLNFPGRLIELELQSSYDGSINMIFTDDKNPVRLVNSRFRLSEDGKSAAIANRRQNKDTNTYSNARFLATRLFKTTNKIPDLQFDGVISGSGELNGGGYRFYFRYIDSDGSLTDIIEESRTVSISYEDHGAHESDNTGRSVQFTMKNLDQQFSGVKIYFSYSAGDVTDTSVVYEISNIYDIPEDPSIDEMVMRVYGSEVVYPISRDALNLNYYSLDHARTITQYDDRLLIGNTTNEFLDYDEFKNLAQKIEIKESTKNMEIRRLGSGYADPNNVYHSLGYWAGETYELGIVWVLKNGMGLTPAFPLRGYDYYEGTSIFGATYTSELIDTADGFVENSSENRLGVYRTKASRSLLVGTQIDDSTPIGQEPSMTELRSLVADMSEINDSEFLSDRVNGFFFVRRPRKKDCLWSGMLTNTAQVPIRQNIKTTGSLRWSAGYPQNVTDLKPNILLLRDYAEEGAGSGGNSHIGPKYPGTAKQGYKIIPAPGRTFEMTVTEQSNGANEETLLVTPAAPEGQYVSLQGAVWPHPDDVESDEEQHWSFYSSDLLCAPAEGAANFNGSKYGIETNEFGAFRGYQRMKNIANADNASYDGFYYKFGGYAYSEIPPITDNASVPTFSSGSAPLAEPRSCLIAMNFDGLVNSDDSNLMTGSVSGHLAEFGNDSAAGNYQTSPGWTLDSDISLSYGLFCNLNTEFLSVPFTFNIAENKITFTVNYTGLSLINYFDDEFNCKMHVEIGVTNWTPGENGDMIWDYVTILWDANDKAAIGSPFNVAFQNYSHSELNGFSTIIGSPTAGNTAPTHFQQELTIPGFDAFIGTYPYWEGPEANVVSEGYPKFWSVTDISEITLNDLSNYELITPVQDIVYDSLEYSPLYPITHETEGLTAEWEYINRGNDAYADGEFAAVSDRNLYGVHRGTTPSSDQTWDIRKLMEDHIEFGDYIGVTFNTPSPSLTSHLLNDTIMVHSLLTKNGNAFTEIFGGYNDIGNYVKRVHYNGFSFGVPAKVFKNRNGHTDADNWKIKYANTSPEDAYFAITKRMKWEAADNQLSYSLYDGDCYINYTYKRSFYRQGVPGVESATDPVAWRDGNQSGGIYPKGMVFPLINESNHNSALRTFQNYSATEKTIYGQHRKFYPLDDIETIRTSRQNETLDYNFGYNHKGEKDQFKIDDRAPFLNINYENRVYISEPAVAGSFINGYRNFFGLAYRDYQKNLGQVISLISHNNQVFMIQENGISSLPINEKTQVSDSEGGVFIKAATILGEKPFVLSSEFGTDQQFSVKKSDNFVYGVDYQKNKVWRLVGSNRPPEIISDFAVAKILNEYKDRLINHPFEEVVITNYDRERNNVIFSYYNLQPGLDLNTDYYININPEGVIAIETADGTATPIALPDFANNNVDNNESLTINGVDYFPVGFESAENDGNGLTSGEILNDFEPAIGSGNDSENQNVWLPTPNGDGVYTLPDGTIFRRWVKNQPATLYYNETLQKWVSRLSWNPIFTFNLGNRLYSFNAIKEEHNIWRHFSKNVPYCHFYGKQDKFYIEFVLVDNPAVQKILENIMIISNESYPTQIKYTIDSNFDFETGSESNSSFEENLKPCVYHVNLGEVEIVDIDGLAHWTSSSINNPEMQRMNGGNIVFDGTTYVFGNSFTQDETPVMPLLDINNTPLGSVPEGFEVNSINFSIFNSNIQYIEDHMYLEIGKSNDKSRIRDKYIRLKLTYRGNDHTVIQSIMSLFNYSHS